MQGSHQHSSKTSRDALDRARRKRHHRAPLFVDAFRTFGNAGPNGQRHNLITFSGCTRAQGWGFERGDHEQKAKNLNLPCAAEIR